MPAQWASEATPAAAPKLAAVIQLSASIYAAYLNQLHTTQPGLIGFCIQSKPDQPESLIFIFVVFISFFQRRWGIEKIIFAARTILLSSQTGSFSSNGYIKHWGIAE